MFPLSCCQPCPAPSVCVCAPGPLRRGPWQVAQTLQRAAFAERSRERSDGGGFRESGIRRDLGVDGLDERAGTVRPADGDPVIGETRGGAPAEEPVALAAGDRERRFEMARAIVAVGEESAEAIELR